MRSNKPTSGCTISPPTTTAKLLKAIAVAVTVGGFISRTKAKVSICPAPAMPIPDKVKIINAVEFAGRNISNNDVASPNNAVT